MLMRGVIVENGVNDHFRGDLLLDFVPEADELQMSMTLRLVNQFKKLVNHAALTRWQSLLKL